MIRQKREEHTERKWCTLEESLNLLKYNSNKEGFKKLYNITVMENIIIKDLKGLEEIKKAISESGAEKLHVIADFDRTLTHSFFEGQRRTSLIAVLRENNYLTEDYPEKARALFDKYHSIEIDPNITVSEKKKTMRQWWQGHFELLIRSGLNKNDIEKAVSSGKIKFRGGADKFFDSLYSNKIPLIILSVNGLGTGAMSMFFEKNGGLHNNIHIISNSFEWDEKGNMVGFKEPLIHSMNKDETVLKNFPAIFQEVEDRPNVLLLGDNLGDVGMIDGFDHENLIKIGFLNENVEENLEQYKNNYDIVILNDSSMEHVNDLLKELI